QAVGFFRVESGPTQAVLPLVGLAAEKVIRDRYMLMSGKVRPKYQAASMGPNTGQPFVPERLDPAIAAT
ncbi:MAG: hypothetical protein ACQESR_16715, partial [Planctomycetota bacterium]